MIKGVQKRMIVLQPEKNSVFETAFFVLRSDLEKSRFDGEAMLLEANRMISENKPSGKRKKHAKKERIRSGFPFFFAGFLFGGFFLLFVLAVSSLLGINY